MDAGPNDRVPVEFLRVNEPFRENAFLLIDMMLKMAPKTRENTSQLVDEILHSIFFMGMIHTRPFSPGEIFAGHDEMLAEVQNTYPEPFRRYFRRLPRRSPFSCVLDMVVSWRGQENEEDIRTRLQAIKNRLIQDYLGRRPLSSAMLCVSRVIDQNESKRHYGVSMSAPWYPSRQILIAASCFSFWNEFVADAVMTFYPEKVRRENFDGTFWLEPRVNCQAFDISWGQRRSPCLSCHNMFGLTTIDTREYPYGNCAEAESLSKLLTEGEARMRVKRSATWNEENRVRVRQEVRSYLVRLLRNVNGFEWDNNYYTPQRARL
ncbi:uncharacterized protein LOC118561623 [Fundulus heteroclitus]|uniref:uncharacterized protein LOC118561623 n=1 Tax=Fundulus heteroclitus TaxID=8078 RepID=UPI00165AF217|nr:uncharacterized protein LOC118561623 [Fundulus heteroclitus]